MCVKLTATCLEDDPKYDKFVVIVDSLEHLGREIFERPRKGECRGITRSQREKGTLVACAC